MNLTDKQHKCYLLMPEGIAFSMDVTRCRDTINVSPVTVSGASVREMGEESKALVEGWAKEEAIRVSN
jgi:hypothetical protein